MCFIDAHPIFNKVVSFSDEVDAMASKGGKIRRSVIAGSWYPGGEAELRNQIKGFFEKAEKKEGEVKALIAPHAGYVYSGQVAAYSFKQLEGKRFKKVFVLAPSHHHPLRGASVADYTHYSTPLGEVEISSVAKELKDKSRLVSNMPEAHAEEHSLEIELPFLQYVLGEFELVPLVVGALSEKEIEELAELIIDRLDDETLVVASTDLSHFHPYGEAVELDRYCVSAIESMSVEKAANGEMCGRFPVLVLMSVAKKLGWKPELLKYANSGDVTGDRSGVVGYAAIAFYGVAR